MTYTVQQAQEDFSRLLKEAEEGKEVVIARDGKPVARLAAVEARTEPRKRRLAGSMRAIPVSRRYFQAARNR